MKVIVDKRFKEEMLTNYIPRIEIMIKKEKEQIKYLEEQKKDVPKSLLNLLKHLEKRYQEYIDYAEKL
jgi:hypothetical protein